MGIASHGPPVAVVLRGFFWKEGKVRTVFFIDGFNVYHSLTHNPYYYKFKWLNYKKLASLFVGAEDRVERILYFTAYAHWNQDKERRHRVLVKALQANGVEVVFGKFKPKDKTCSLCKGTYRTYEEKMTDVNIAVHLFRAAVKNEFDKAILITGDTDLVPVVRSIREMFPAKKIGVVFPINRAADELKQVADFHKKIKVYHLASSRFPDTICLANGTVIQCPATWR